MKFDEGAVKGREQEMCLIKGGELGRCLCASSILREAFYNPV